MSVQDSFAVLEISSNGDSEEKVNVVYNAFEKSLFLLTQ